MKRSSSVPNWNLAIYCWKPPSWLPVLQVRVISSLLTVIWSDEFSKDFLSPLEWEWGDKTNTICWAGAGLHSFSFVWSTIRLFFCKSWSSWYHFRAHSIQSSSRWGPKLLLLQISEFSLQWRKSSMSIRDARYNQRDFCVPVFVTILYLICSSMWVFSWFLPGPLSMINELSLSLMQGSMR
jgi:hypothetical protein